MTENTDKDASQQAPLNGKSDNKAIVTQFIESWPMLDAKQLASYFSEDGVYFNIPSKPVKGRDNIEKFINDFIADWRSTRWEIISMEGEENTIIVERKDHTKTKSRSFTLPCTGIFIMENGKIQEWRDYFDMLTYVRGAGILNLIKFGVRQAF